MTRTGSSTLLHTHDPGKPQNGVFGRPGEKTNQNQADGNIDPKLRSSLSRALEELDAGTDLLNQPDSHPNVYAESVQKKTLRNGLLSLLGRIEIPGQSWKDAMDYCREVIQCPQDSSERAGAKWARSYSDLCRHMLKEFGPEIIAVARRGCEALARDYYQGNPLNIAHVDKKSNTKRLLPYHEPTRLFHPQSSLLAAACCEQTSLCCSIVTSAWLPPEKAVDSGMISHVAVADDYHEFTATEYETRIRMVALSVGAAYEAGGQVVNVLVDGTALQAVGTGDQLTVDAVRAWRAVGGCTTPYSSYLWGQGSLEDGIVAPELIMAMHDLLDWRSDTAARNHENGVSAVYGLAYKDAFHTYLEATLHRASSEPLSGLHAMAGIVFLHYTSIRYGSYRYRGDHGGPCGQCERILADVTAKAGLQWKPTPPPSNFTAAQKYRQLGKEVVDQFEKHPLAQIGLSWLQHLIVTGEIWLFDAQVPIPPLDAEAAWA